MKRLLKNAGDARWGQDYRPKKYPSGHITSTRPWEILSVDVVRPLPRTKHGYRFVLSALDCFSRFVVLVPLEDHTAESVARALHERIIGYFGAPEKILTDRGQEFRSKIWESLTDLYGIKRHLTSPYYPQGNAMVERMHRTMANMIRATMIEKAERDWSTLLPGVMLALNEMPQD